MSSASGFEQVNHVLKVLNMASLVRAYRDTVDIFLQRSQHDLINTPVVTQMNHLRTLLLHDPAHDINRRIMAIK